MVRSLFDARAETTPAEPKSTQMKFRLAGHLSALIEKAAAEHGWGASEEIRRRLVASFLDEPRAEDEETNRLLDAIETIAQNIEPPFGVWHQSRFAFEVFRSAVVGLLDLQRPPGDAVRPSGNAIADLYLGENGTPEAAGRVLAGSAATAAGIPLPGQRHEKERR
jgi:hypothetical protein